MQPYLVCHSGKGSPIGLEEAEAVLRTFQQDTLAYGPTRDRFERTFAAYIDAAYAFTTSSCTAALYLSTQLIDLKPGDEVILTPQTFWAALRPLQAAGARIVFGDIDPNTLNLDPATIEPLINPRTKAIYVVHMGGLAADMDAICDVAARHGLFVVEDCAHAAGSLYKGRRTGSLGHIGCFSFHSVKNMTTLGEGGMITFGQEEWAEEVRQLRSIGVSYPWRRRTETGFGPYRRPQHSYGDHSRGAYIRECQGPVRVGNNYRMSEPASAVGLVQLKQLDSFNERRRRIASLLNDGLESIPGIRIQEVPVGYLHAFHLFVFFYQPRRRGSNEEKEELIRLLDAEERIEIVNRYFPLHLLPEMRAEGHQFGECPVAERVWFEEQVNLPLHPALTVEQIEQVVDAVCRSVSRVRGT